MILTEKFKEMIENAKKDLSSFDVLENMKEVLELVNKNQWLASEIREHEGKIVVFEALDTGRAVTIEFVGSQVKGEFGKREDFDLKFSATEETYLSLLTGQLDPDSAFFTRRIKIKGSIPEALRFKNIFFGKVLANV